jgi:UDP-glucose 4-epimerase
MEDGKCSEGRKLLESQREEKESSTINIGSGPMVQVAETVRQRQSVARAIVAINMYQCRRFGSTEHLTKSYSSIFKSDF